MPWKTPIGYFLSKLTGGTTTRTRMRPFTRPLLELLERRELLTNNLPVAMDDSVRMNEDTSAVIRVLDNDSDPDNDPLRPALVGMPVSGTVLLDDNSTPTNFTDDFFRYTPYANFSGHDSILYEVTDGRGGQSYGVVYIDIDPVGDGFAPVAAADTAATHEDTPVAIDVVANDSNPDYWPLTLSVFQSPQNGTAAVNDNTTPNDPADDYLVYTPTANWSGTDNFVYRIDDGHGGSSTATVTVTILPVDDAALGEVFDRWNWEGDYAEVQVTTPDRVASPATFTATGLPPGLSIDGATGLISGHVRYTATSAASVEVPFQVTVRAEADGQADEKQFVWRVRDTNWVDRLDDRVSVQGDAVGGSVLFDGFSGDPDPVFAAVGLPPGVALSPATGQFSGTVAPPPADKTAYNVTVTVTVGAAVETRSFRWTVLDGQHTHAFIALRGTLSDFDDVGVVGEAMAARVTLYTPLSGVVPVEIQVPSGRASVSSPLLQLANRQAVDILVTPLVDSDAADDIGFVALVQGQQVGQAQANGITVEYNNAAWTDAAGGRARIRAANTPAGMDDRIPPRTFTPMAIKITGNLGGRPLFLTKRGYGGNNGDFNFRGIGGAHAGCLIYDGADIGRVTNPDIFGVADKQTVPGNKNNLYVQLEFAPNASLRRSEGFSVAAIPVGVAMTNARRAQAQPGPVFTEEGFRYRPIAWGALYDMAFVSDSENPNDLDMVTFNEVLTPKAAGTGVFNGYAPRPREEFAPVPQVGADLNGMGTQQDARKTVAQNQQDSLTAFRRILSMPGRVPGSYEHYQHWIFRDARTGLTQAKPIANSGFVLLLEARRFGADSYSIAVKRTAAASQDGAVAAGTLPAAAAEWVESEVVLPPR